MTERLVAVALWVLSGCSLSGCAWTPDEQFQTVNSALGVAVLILQQAGKK